MDWEMIRKSMDDAMQACIENDGVMDEAAKQLVAFVPADPNKKADAEWLKERGWVKSEVPGVLIQAEYGIGFEVFGGKPRMWFLSSHFTVRNPTRMTVALFEAAAMEARKESNYAK